LLIVNCYYECLLTLGDEALAAYLARVVVVIAVFFLVQLQLVWVGEGMIADVARVALAAGVQLRVIAQCLRVHETHSTDRTSARKKHDKKIKIRKKTILEKEIEKKIVLTGGVAPCCCHEYERDAVSTIPSQLCHTLCTRHSCWPCALRIDAFEADLWSGISYRKVHTNNCVHLDVSSDELKPRSVLYTRPRRIK
jgi:hypothetical protein